ncbi:ral guanine nucleotide dissociation stimulator-like [Manis pentadactyla]|uniref:ral guanine nucleotide dissociation stimulator-like n=1 Tax=Manis pentadactyla TaxID=143292 RepID=UPI00255CA9AE|nr:ral guanine nucleotide dissociation stimulator-like [Manis pentadactyla]
MGFAPRLSTCWPHVSLLLSPPLSVCLMVYEDLKTQDNWVHRKRLFKEMESILRARQRGRMGPKERMTKDLIPYLGLILDDSVDKHLEYEDFAVIESEITMQRQLAEVYDLERDECFLSFAQAVEPLDEEESYNLSCQLEPPCQRASRKGRSFRSHKI